MAGAREVVENLLRLADIRIGGTRPFDIQVHDERFFARVMADGTLGMGEAYVDGWWDCEAIDEMCCRAIAARVEERFTWTLPNLRALARSLLMNRQARRRRVGSARRITTSETIFSGQCWTHGCNIPVRFSSTATTWRRRKSASSK